MLNFIDLQNNLQNFFKDTLKAFDKFKNKQKSV